MSLYEINEIVDLVSKAAGRDANIVFGAIISENMQDEIRVICNCY
jgi:cell division protein FtsZ